MDGEPISGVTWPAGTYLVSVDGLFESAVNARDPAVDVYLQISLWIDRSGAAASSGSRARGTSARTR